VELVIELAYAHASSVGIDFESTQKLGGIWIVRRHEIDYQLPALLGEEILEEPGFPRCAVRAACATRASPA
jgi:hypothetical protein